jgi:hypothetical protein
MVLGQILGDFFPAKLILGDFWAILGDVLGDFWAIFGAIFFPLQVHLVTLILLHIFSGSLRKVFAKRLLAKGKR